MSERTESKHVLQCYDGVSLWQDMAPPWDDFAGALNHLNHAVTYTPRQRLRIVYRETRIIEEVVA